MHSGFKLGGYARHRRVHAHAARVRAQVAIECALVVLRAGHGKSLAFRKEREHAAFGAFEHFLDNHHAARFAEVAREAIANGLFGFFHIFGNHDALASSKAVGLHDNGSAHLVQVIHGLILRRALFVARRGKAMGQHEFLREAFGTFEARTLRTRAEHRDARRANSIGDASDQRSLGANNHKVDVLAACEADNSISIVHVEGDVFRNSRRATIARSNEQRVEARRFRNGPC